MEGKELYVLEALGLPNTPLCPHFVTRNCFLVVQHLQQGSLNFQTAALTLHGVLIDPKEEEIYMQVRSQRSDAGYGRQEGEAE